MEKEVFNTEASWRERGFFLKTAPVIIVSYDPAGGGADRDALVMTAREEHQKGEVYDPDFAVATKFRVLAAQRMPLQLEFPDKFARLLSLHKSLEQWDAAGRSFAHFFAIETNGVGWAIASALRDKIGPYVIPYTTVGKVDEKPFGDNGRVSMPRLAALDHLRVLLETHVLKMAPNAQGGKELASELGSFVWARPGRPEALTGQHDDLVMALCGGIWVGSKIIQPTLKGKRFRQAS